MIFDEVTMQIKLDELVSKESIRSATKYGHIKEYTVLYSSLIEELIEVQKELDKVFEIVGDRKNFENNLLGAIMSKNMEEIKLQKDRVKDTCRYLIAEAVQVMAVCDNFRPDYKR